MNDLAIELRGVTAGYGDTTVLHDVNLKVGASERLAIVGRNGVGKTTLMGTIMGTTRLHAGSVWFQGQDISRLSPHKRAIAGLGLVPQTRNIFPSLTVEENLIAGLRGDASIEEAYALFPRLKERRRNGGGNLSGGEQQMLAIARTLMGQPAVLLLDEPLEGLAPVIREMLMETFDALASKGKHTLLLVEQHTALALRFAERVIILDAGKVVHDGAAEELLSDPAILERHVGMGLAEV
nr:branched-chain amino acid ABC transporter, ATP-binding protein [uncultured bacterium]BAH90474.1 branched-chain amino acid ABC transporter, ATP-binding protein [uncultured bacterium]